MLRIGMLEQLDLSSVLRRVETHSKTGLMIIKQGSQWVELYFRDGRLMCIGPVRTNANLGERLLRDGVISPDALAGTLAALGNVQQSETRMALTLMDLGHVSHEELRAWATYNAKEVLRALLAWKSGEISFSEDTAPPADRLLVALSISVLLSSIVPTTPVPQPEPAVMAKPTRNLVQPEPAVMPKPTRNLGQPEPVVMPKPTRDLGQPVPAAQNITNIPTFVSASDLLLDDADDAPLTTVFSSTDMLSAILPSDDANNAAQPSPSTAIMQPVAVMSPVPPKRIDTSFMRPDMILVPVDLSAARERNPQVQLTPDQWRLLTKVDGHTSLQVACMDLAMTPEMICQVAGELIAEGLIQLSLSSRVQMNELSPSSKELVSSGITNGYVVPGYAGDASPSPASDAQPQFPSSLPYETQSQWGNGGNGATFIPGRGWIASPQPLQPLPTSGPLAATYSDIYANAGGGR